MVTKETIVTSKKIILSCVNYRTLHVKQPDAASGAGLKQTPVPIDEFKKGSTGVIKIISAVKFQERRSGNVEHRVARVEKSISFIFCPWIVFR